MEFSSLNGYKVKDKKAIRYYDTVASMKADITLKNNMHVKTKGYYEANDGGSAEYIITNDNTLIADNGIVHDLDNGLKANLIINNNCINAEQIGMKTSTDSEPFNNTPILQEYYSHGIYTKINFGKGNYYFSECLFAGGTSGVLNSKIYLNGLSLNHQRITFFKPYQANQRFIFKFGGYADFSAPEIRSEVSIAHIRIEGITFTDNNNPISSSSSDILENGLLSLDQVYAFNSESLDFYQCTGQCMYIRDSYEIYLNCVNARELLNMNHDYSIFYFARNTNSHTNNNNSNFNCNCLDTEYLRSHIYSVNGNFTNHHIGTIIIETAGDTTFALSNIGTLINTIRADYIKIPYFYLRNGSAGNLTIDTINTDHFCDGYWTENNNNYMMSVIKAEKYWGNVNFKEINIGSNGFPFFESYLSEIGSSSYNSFGINQINVENLIFGKGYISSDYITYPRYYFINLEGNDDTNGTTYINVKSTNGILNPDYVKTLLNGYYTENKLFELAKLTTTSCLIRHSRAKYFLYNLFIRANNDLFLKFKFMNSNKITLSGIIGYPGTTINSIFQIQLYDNSDTLLETLTHTAHDMGFNNPFTETFDLTGKTYEYFKIINTHAVFLESIYVE